MADRESEEFERALRQLGPRDQNLAAAVKTSLAGGQSRADALAALTRFRQELASAILISGPISGAGVNPARAIGPMILTGKFTDWWAYLTAPLVAGILAVAIYDRILRPPAGKGEGE